MRDLHPLSLSIGNLAPNSTGMVTNHKLPMKERIIADQQFLIQIRQKNIVPESERSELLEIPGMMSLNNLAIAAKLLPRRGKNIAGLMFLIHPQISTTALEPDHHLLLPHDQDINPNLTNLLRSHTHLLAAHVPRN